MLYYIIVVILLGIADKFRGHTNDLIGFGVKDVPKLGRFTDKVIYGYLMACLFGYSVDLFAILIIIGMFIGMTPGWGNPFGAVIDNRSMDIEKSEWWQFGILKTNEVLALIFRGVMWGVSVAILTAWYDTRLLILIPAYAIAMPLTPHLTRDWSLAELLRGWLVGTICLGYMHYV